MGDALFSAARPFRLKRLSNQITMRAYGALALFALVIFSFATVEVEADLNVHCLHKHVRGTWTFHLGTPDQHKEKEKGTWTMIYDEGFEVTIADTKFFAFSKYTSDNMHDYSHREELVGFLLG